MAGQTTLPLQSKTAIITGGSRGLGEGIKLELARRGVDPSYHRSLSLNPNHFSCSLTPSVLGVQADLRNAEAIKEITSFINKWFEEDGQQTKIHILVNNVDGQVVKPLGEITAEDFADLYDLNVRGSLLMTQAILPHLSRPRADHQHEFSGEPSRIQGARTILSEQSCSGRLTRCRAAELGKNGTTVNAVKPGPVKFEMLDDIPEDIVEMQKAQTPLQNRVGTVAEVAAVACWLAGEDSRWVTGQTINASGRVDHLLINAVYPGLLPARKAKQKKQRR